MAADNSHIMMSYGSQSTTGLVYNLYVDKFLKLDLVPQQIYDIQTDFLVTQSREYACTSVLSNLF